MAAGTLSPPKVVSREEWLSARRALFVEEKEITHKLDELRKKRRHLPWMKIEKPYVFEGPDGRCTLADLFHARGQLAVYHFMLTPGSDHVCKGCSFVADHFDAARKHFDDADLSFAVISRAPIERIEQNALWAGPSRGCHPMAATSTLILGCHSKGRTWSLAQQSSITTRSRSRAAKI
jgi:predicted dithiol-disulfide oxidoreductase (DUF899 family)